MEPLCHALTNQHARDISSQQCSAVLVTDKHVPGPRRLALSLTLRPPGLPAAQEYCAVQGGSLVVYTSAAQQLLVERTISLPWHYWLGVRRDNSSVPYSAASGATVAQATSNARPYSHWCAAWL
jgi:hypothetical protein